MTTEETLNNIKQFYHSLNNNRSIKTKDERK